MAKRGLLIRIVYSVCLAGATINHVRSVLLRGWFPEQLPHVTALYWSSLTFLDPLAAVLLFIRPRIGIASTALIIVSDVSHNLWFIAGHQTRGSLGEKVASSPFMTSQIVFLLFVALTAPLAWSDDRWNGGSH